MRTLQLFMSMGRDYDSELRPAKGLQFIPRWQGTESHGGTILTEENQGTRSKTCPSATLSTTNPTQTDSSAKPGLRCERPSTNRLSHDTTSFLSTCRGGARKDQYLGPEKSNALFFFIALFSVFSFLLSFIFLYVFLLSFPFFLFVYLFFSFSEIMYLLLRRFTRLIHGILDAPILTKEEAGREIGCV
jgi:hypothetical protein